MAAKCDKTSPLMMQSKMNAKFVPLMGQHGSCFNPVRFASLLPAFGQLRADFGKLRAKVSRWTLNSGLGDERDRMRIAHQPNNFNIE